jgi:predicted GTPase
MEIIKYCHHRGDIDEVATHHSAFIRLKHAKIRQCLHLTWQDKNDGYISYQAQAAFFGKTGYGKSTTVNALFGNPILKTSDVGACTRECQCLDFELSPNCYLSFADFPGIGENEYRDKEYLTMYNSFLSSSVAVIYILRADTRDYSLDESAYQAVFSSVSDKKKIIFALNCCDKIEPISRSYSSEPTTEQLNNIRRKVDEVKNVFNPINQIIPYSAQTGWNLNLLSSELVELICKSKDIVLYQ